jgi:hypothetical protein
MFRVVKNSLRVDVAPSVTLFLLVTFSAPVDAQLTSRQSKGAKQAEAAARKVTPEQERGLRLLKAAEGESAQLQPDMHAFILWRLSYAYTKLDPKQAQNLSRSAFTATQAIEDPSENDHCAALGSPGDIKSWIQQRVLYEMVHKDQLQEAEQLLPQATPPVRNEITAELVRHYESKRDLPRAEALLSQLANSDQYPFGAAADLVTALGAERSADRMSIFNQALDNFEQHATKTSFGGDDIGSFIGRTWKDVPPGLVLEAIDKVLDAAKEQGSPSHYSMSSAKGTIILNSSYDVRLFQLLPILQELDKDKADSLLRERTDVAEQLKMYPRGIQSLNPESASFSYGVSDNGSPIGGAASKQQIEAQMQERIEGVLKQADMDPSGALASALILPIHGTSESSSPRSRALLGIAEKAAAKKPSVSKAALDNFSALQDQLTPQEITGIDKLPGLYLKVGDLDGAKKAVDILVKAASKIYEHDTDADDPNNAFKGAWPSTDLWRKAIQQAAKVSSALPEELIANLQDAEIAALEKVAFASTLVVEVGMSDPILVSDCRKTGVSYQVSF